MKCAVLLALLWIVPAAAEEMPPMGVFVDNRPYAGFSPTLSGQREAGTKAWEKLLNRPANSLLASDYYGTDSWASFTDAANGTDKPRDWRFANQARKLMWSIPLTMKGTPLANVARGFRDREFHVAAKAIAAAQPDAIIRIGWEMNGAWMAWHAGKGQEQDYIAAYRHVAQIFKDVSPDFRFDWSTTFGLADNDPELAYPGDDVVDTIGMDVYDYIWTKAPESDPKKRWDNAILDAKGRGLNWLVGFSKAHGKPMSLGEWGVGLTDSPASPVYGSLKDSPYFVEKMRDWLAQNAAQIKFQIYFDAPPHRIDDGSFPKSLAALKAKFGK